MMATKVIDNNVFTFKPKVSKTSSKIAESLDSDFMSRQQQHLEKKRRNIEQASMHLSHTTSLDLNKHKKSLNEGVNKSGRRSESEMCSKDEVVAMEVSETNGGRLSSKSDSDQDQLYTKMETDEQLEDDESGAISDPDHISQSRSKTMPPAATSLGPRKSTNINLDRLKNAKLMAEKAVKNRKVFMIQGPYPAIRQSLRERGWVEKFYRMNSNNLPKKSPRAKKKRAVASDTDDDNTDDDDDDDDDDDPNADDPNDHGGKIAPWEEDSGIYGIMSRIVRNAAPTFIWSVRRDVIDPKAMKKDQIINHFGKAGSFTTKVGLCVNMRNLTWFQEADPNTYFPRCYKFSQEDEKQAFIDDYRITACINVLKHVKEQHERELKEAESQETGENSEKDNLVCVNPDCTKSRPNTNQGNRCIHAASGSNVSSQQTSPRKGNVPLKKKKVVYVPLRSVEIAMLRCQRYIHCLNHDDLDEEEDAYYVSDAEWDEFLQWYYKIIHDGALIPSISNKMAQIGSLLSKLRECWPQYELDGTQNVWMLKAGAKSRGRGIVPYDRLEDMLKLVNFSVVQKEGKYVVQKYIERPMLVYNTKFDIRQWFLVTDWNPLTIWFYKESYLRFCSQEYTLDNFDEAIHLSNNAIQKNYESNPNRSKFLPLENMWDCDEFKDYLRRRGHVGVWQDKIYPGMKKAVLGALLCSQDIVEYRKNSFELYGADFMLTEDLQPWLIEINCSPSMSSSTKVTAKLCNAVLADTVKVVIDRKYDKNADTGRFELVHKQPYVHVPPYIGMSLTVEGNAVKKPGWMTRKPAPLNIPDLPGMTSITSPQTSDSNVDTEPSTSKSTVVSSSTSKSGAPVGGAIGRVVTQSYTHMDKKMPNRQTSTVSQSMPVFAKSTHKLKRTRSRRSPSKSESKTEITDDKSQDKTPLAISSKSAEVVSLSSRLKDSTTGVDKSIKLKGSSTGPVNLSPCGQIKGKQCLRPNSAKDVLTVSLDAKLSSRRTRCSSTIETPNDVDECETDNVMLTQSMNCSPCNSMAAFESPTSSKLSLRRETEPRQMLTTAEICMLGYTDQHNTLGRSTPEKQVLQLKSAETVDIQAMHNEVQNKGYVMSSPLIDSTWGRTCNHCGNGMNLKLDHSVASPCQCQQDSVRVGTEGQWYPRAASVGRSGNPLQTPFTVTMSFPQRSHTPHPPSMPPKPNSMLPKRIHIDKNKLVSSVYTKAQTYNTTHPANCSGLQKSGKVVLRYTDGNIQKPEMTTKVCTQPFPKLVSRYIGKRVNKDGIPICMEPYRQSKITVITQSFQ